MEIAAQKEKAEKLSTRNQIDCWKTGRPAVDDAIYGSEIGLAWGSFVCLIINILAF